MRLLTVLLATVCLDAVLGAKKKPPTRHCTGTKNLQFISRKNLACIRGQVSTKKNYPRMESEYMKDYEAKIKRCFDDDGNGECGTFEDVAGENVFLKSSEQRNPSRCSGCDSAFSFLGGKYFGNRKIRNCMNQFFLDVISARAKQCTGKYTPILDTDSAALEYREDLEKSVSRSMAWRYFADVCEAKGNKASADKIRKCMAEEPRLPKYCDVHDRCYKRRFRRCKGKGQNTLRTAGLPSLAAKTKICKCFNGKRDRLMTSLKGVADDISKAAAKIDGYSAQSCVEKARKLMKPMAYNETGNWRVDWLDVFYENLKECDNAPLPMPPNVLLVDLPCGDMAKGPYEETGLTPIQHTLYFISNFASALVDRMVRFCRC